MSSYIQTLIALTAGLMASCQEDTRRRAKDGWQPRAWNTKNKKRRQKRKGKS